MFHLPKILFPSVSAAKPHSQTEKVSEGCEPLNPR